MINNLSSLSELSFMILKGTYGLNNNYEVASLNNDNEIMITALNNIGDAFELYIKEPTQERKVFLMMNLKQVQMSLNF